MQSGRVSVLILPRAVKVLILAAVSGGGSNRAQIVPLAELICSCCDRTANVVTKPGTKVAKVAGINLVTKRVDVRIPAIYITGSALVSSSDMDGGCEDHASRVARVPPHARMGWLLCALRVFEAHVVALLRSWNAVISLIVRRWQCGRGG